LATVVVVVVNCTVITYNAALNRPAFQSSIYSDRHGRYPANLANDGSFHTHFQKNGKPACVLSLMESNPWWAVDLGKPTTVYKVDFINIAYRGMYVPTEKLVLKLDD